MFALATPEAIARYEAVVGLEVHVQLSTATKIFCGCPTGFGAPPNTNVCPVCLGLPGALPVLNRAAVELAIKAALALNCRIRPHSRFARKNYFYPDLPKGYQISQYDEPFAEHGFVDIMVDGAPKRIGVTRVHMEDDAGKSIHEGFRDSEPLLLRGPQPQRHAAHRDRQRTGHAQLRGSLRLPHRGQAGAPVHRGIELRHGEGPSALRCQRIGAAQGRGEAGHESGSEEPEFVPLLKAGAGLRNRAPGGADRRRRPRACRKRGCTIPIWAKPAGMRSKEEAHDYRYFPEPDLVPLRIGDAMAGGNRGRRCRSCRRARRARFLRGIWAFGVRYRGADGEPRDERIFRDGGARLGQSENGGKLGDGRPDGAAEGGGQGDRGIAR